MHTTNKEVRFDLFCPTCEYRDREERMDPCNECLETGMNIESSKPVMYKEKTDD